MVEVEGASVVQSEGCSVMCVMVEVGRVSVVQSEGCDVMCDGGGGRSANGAEQEV